MSYAQLKSGTLTLDGKEVATVPLSSLVRAREVAQHLKEWIESGRFLLGEPVELLSKDDEAPFSAQSAGIAKIQTQSSRRGDPAGRPSFSHIFGRMGD